MNCCRAFLGRNDGLAVERARARRPDDEMLLEAILSVSRLSCKALWQYGWHKYELLSLPFQVHTFKCGS